MVTGWLFQLGVFLVILIVIAYALGEYLGGIFGDKGSVVTRMGRPLERTLYRLCGIAADREMGWKAYALAVALFNGVGIVALFLIQELQHLLPLNPGGVGPVRWDTAVNTAVSFVTNTNWQAYSGESTMSYLTQMLGMTVQNFVSAASGIAVMAAFIRAFARHSVTVLGNFWVDLTRAILYLLLPLAVAFSFILVSQGAIQNLRPAVKAVTVEGREQTIPQGPVASQVAIKILGTNGGGFFNANAAHPFENPTPMTDYFEILGLLAIAAAAPFAFGRMTGARRQGWALFSAMLVLYLAGLGAALWAETHGNPVLSKLGIAGGMNYEGKEVRFGELASVVFAHATTVTSCGAVNCMHDSLMPLTGMVLLFNIALGEAIFGGVGTGLISMIVYAVITMFLVGLMIGRTPEIFGKKLEPREMLMAAVILLVPTIVQLVCTAAGVSTRAGLGSIANAGPHGLSEIMYAFVSMAGNNGSAFAGLNANTPFYNLAGAAAMAIGRFAVLIPALTIAGSLAQKKHVPPSARFPTASPLFVAMLAGVVIIVGALSFFPPLTLGPLLEHLFLQGGKTF